MERKICMEAVIRKYFECWLKKNAEPLADIFSDHITYTECYGPEYQGIEQILQWFNDWNKKGTVLRWDIKYIFVCGKTLVVEWFFQCDYCRSIDGFDGVTIAEFDSNNKICNLREFQSKSEQNYPYS